MIAVVPARYAASRFPGKPLADLAGRPVIRWVYEAAAGSQLFDEVVVATDDERIAHAVNDFGGSVELTQTDHRTGTDRVAEVADRRPEAEVVVNVQGDQPFVHQAMLAALVQPYLDGDTPAMSTLACPVADESLMLDPNVVKVVCDLHGHALYFSRSPIPYTGDGEASVLHHLGLYAFTRATLLAFPSLPSGPLERTERLEQLRALEHGMRIRVCQTAEAGPEINTPADLEMARRFAERSVPGNPAGR
jgi:3-deoxy-manno-octulosonate cytidylyltransferase (CMP-KDO synthetase)